MNKHPYKIVINSNNKSYEYKLSEDKDIQYLGNVSGCSLRINGDITEETVKLELRRVSGTKETGGEIFEITGNDGVYLQLVSDQNSIECKRMQCITMRHGQCCKICSQESGEGLCSFTLLINFEENLPFINYYINLADKNNIKISGDEGSDLVIISEYGRNNTIEINNTGADFILNAKSVPYGLKINGTSVGDNIRLKNYDYISFADIAMFFRNGKLLFDKAAIRAVTVTPHVIHNEGVFDYPKFVRNTRIGAQISDESISVLDPSNKPEKPELNIATSLLPAIVMFALCVVLRGFMSKTGGTFVIFSICSMGIGVITSIVSMVNGQKKYKKTIKKRKENYARYIERKRGYIAESRQDELEALESKYYSLGQDLENILNFDTKLFDRDKTSEDFLDLYLGVGKKKSLRQIEYSKQDKIIDDDELSAIPAVISEDFEYIEKAPIFLPLKTAGAVGIVGTEEERYEMFKNIVIDICARHYYNDVKLVCFLDDDYSKYEYIKYIPHMEDENHKRYVVVDDESKAEMFEYLYKVLSSRGENSENIPHYIILAMNERGIRMHPLCQFIEKAGNLGATFIFFEERTEFLPQYCTSIVELSKKDTKKDELDREESDNIAYLYSSSNCKYVSTFEYETISDVDMRRAAIKLSPIFSEEISLSGSLRKSISLFELLDIYEVGDLDLSSRWKNSKVYKSMAVPLGVNSAEDIVYLDLHEKYHGPHGLVAGTTGSGKSEILQSYILGAATLFSPEEIGFMIIDFKGGGMATQFTELPHLMGVITNIDGKAIDRSLKSIKAELLKRQEYFAEAGVNHIDKYIKLYSEKKVETPLPHLIIIVDEFAELKAEQPEFMKELISAARIGRSLGVHLILATQKPAGQVNDQIWSNSKFKLCLKVQTKEDSNEVIKSPLAAEIREPGRAYLQVGNNEIFELFQSGFSGAPEQAASDDREYKLFELDFKGNKKLIFEKKKKKEKESRTQLDALVSYIHDYCCEHGIKKLKPICLPALKENIEYDVPVNTGDINDNLVYLGVYDDPDNQYQGISSIPIDENILIVGSSQMGKTNLLMTIIRNLCDCHSTKELALYIMDFGSMFLKNFENLYHVGGVATPAEDDKVANLFKLLGKEIATRKAKLLSSGVSSYSSYLETGNNDIPRIIVLIDNYTMLKETYPEESEQLSNLLREGISVGISFIIANAVTTGMNLKIMASISQKIGFYNNDKNIFAGLYGKTKYCPDEIPGRCVFEKDKNVYEMQVFRAFEGEKEIDRVESIRNWIQGINKANTGNRAKRIPVIPAILNPEEVNVASDREICLGLSYQTIEPVIYNLIECNELMVVGGRHSGKSNFIRYIVNEFKQKSSLGKIVLFGNGSGKYSEYASEGEYYVEPDKAAERLVSLFDEIKEEKLDNQLRRIIILDSEEIISTIVKNKEAIEAYRGLVGRYKSSGNIIIITCNDNVAIGITSNEIYKHVKENRNIISFTNASEIKVVDISQLVLRNFKKEIEAGDAYYIKGTTFSKIKTPFIR